MVVSACFFIALSLFLDLVAVPGLCSPPSKITRSFTFSNVGKIACLFLDFKNNSFNLKFSRALFWLFEDAAQCSNSIEAGNDVLLAENASFPL